MSDDERDANGRFAPGNSGGPGRPRRAVEREYLAVLGEAVTLDDWRDVVSRAVADAKAGDATARAWLAKYLLGETPLQLLDLAAREVENQTADEEIAAKAAEVRHMARLNQLFEAMQ